MIVSVYLPDSIGELVAAEADAHPLELGVPPLTRGSWIARQVMRALEREGSLAKAVLSALEASEAPLTAAQVTDGLPVTRPGTEDHVLRTLLALTTDTPTRPAKVVMVDGRFTTPGRVAP